MGVEVQVEHTGAAVLGSIVRGVAKVTELDGRRVAFEVQAYAGDREIGRGKHRRAVVHLERLVANVTQMLKGEDRVTNLKPATDALGEWETLAVEVSNRIATVTFEPPRRGQRNQRADDRRARVARWLGWPGIRKRSGSWWSPARPGLSVPATT